MNLHWEQPRGVDQVDGLDGLLLRIMASRMNFTIQLLPNEPPELVGGSSYLNGTMTGAYRMLLDRRANLTLSSAVTGTIDDLPPVLQFVGFNEACQPAAAWQTDLFRKVDLMLGFGNNLDDLLSDTAWT
ncbi:Hypothetical predicted protein [Drosophila guanche]|uniref:Uncharacterized protein n=1 Tax=Drosophila guanche TaxID=7266 RepID=A0A3B0J8W4_DROGU|nr:Hypothetical predicted protein [Drosophila guanche]